MSQSKPILNFSELIGNANQIALLHKAATRDALGKFTVLYGAYGTGKSTAAFLLALYSVCEARKNGEPCLSCDPCKSVVGSLRTKGEARNVIKQDMTKLTNEKEINTFLESVFTYLQSYTGTNVYIFEELHELPLQHQAKLLDGIDSLGENTKVIATTSRVTELYPEAVDRSIRYEFLPLTRKESSILAQREAKKINMKLGKTEEDLVIKYARGSARSVVNMIEFMAKVTPTLAELQSHVGVIDYMEFVALMESLGARTVDLIATMKEMFTKHSPARVIQQMKEFLLNFVIAVRAGDRTYFTTDQIDLLSKILTRKMFNVLSEKLESMDIKHTSEEDLYLVFLRLQMLSRGKDVKEIFTENAQMAAKQSVESKTVEREMTDLEQRAQTVTQNMASSSFFQNLGGGSREGED